VAISNAEQGTLTEAEFVKIVMLTSHGKAVPTRPVVADEHRRSCIGTREEGPRLFRGMIPFQVKASLGSDAHGKSRPFRLSLSELGPRIVEILNQLGRSGNPRFPKRGESLAA
jgi:hypothetical protein